MILFGIGNIDVLTTKLERVQQHTKILSKMHEKVKDVCAKERTTVSEVVNTTIKDQINLRYMKS